MPAKFLHKTPFFIVGLGLFSTIAHTDNNLLTYKSTIEQALAINPEVLISDEKIKQSYFDVGIAQSSLYPKLSLTAKAGREHKSPGGGRQKYDPLGKAAYMSSSDFLLSFEQLIFDGFISTAEVKRKRLNWLGSYHRANLIRHKVAKQVTDIFFDIYYQVKTINQLDTFLSELEKLGETVTISAEEGAASRLMDKFVSSRLSFAKQSRIQAETALNDSLDTYASLTGVTLDLSDKKIKIPELNPLLDFDSYQARMMTYNPDILRKYLDLLAAKEDIKKAKGAYYPTFKLLADFNETNDSGGKVGAVKYGSVMLEMSYKIFDGFSRVKSKKKTLSVAEEKDREIQRTLKKLDRNLTTAWQTVKAKEEERQLVQKELEDSQEVKALRRDEFYEGSGDIVQLIEAVENVHSIILRQYGLDKEFMKNRFDLEFISGKSNLLAGINLKLDDPQAPAIDTQKVEMHVRSLADIKPLHQSQKALEGDEEFIEFYESVYLLDLLEGEGQMNNIALKQNVAEPISLNIQTPEEEVISFYDELFLSGEEELILTQETSPLPLVENFDNPIKISEQRKETQVEAIEPVVKKLKIKTHTLSSDLETSMFHVDQVFEIEPAAGPLKIENLKPALDKAEPQPRFTFKVLSLQGE